MFMVYSTSVRSNTAEECVTQRETHYLLKLKNPACAFGKVFRISKYSEDERRSSSQREVIQWSQIINLYMINRVSRLRITACWWCVFMSVCVRVSVVWAPGTGVLRPVAAWRPHEVCVCVISALLYALQTCTNSRGLFQDCTRQFYCFYELPQLWLAGSRDVWCQISSAGLWVSVLETGTHTLTINYFSYSSVIILQVLALMFWQFCPFPKQLNYLLYRLFWVLLVSKNVKLFYFFVNSN